jgi:heptaprenylglyceryl phosphate synthase
MQSTVADQRQQAHMLLDTLPEDKVAAAHHMLESLAEFSYTLETAPLDDEEVTPETIAAVKKARASLAAGGGSSHEDVRREFGL